MPNETVEATLRQQDYRRAIEKDIKDWCDTDYKIQEPFQQHILPSKFSDVKPDDLEFFLCAEQGVLGIDAKPKYNPKV